MSAELYELISAGGGCKWERLGPYVLKRPYSQGVWPYPENEPQADACFERFGENGRWTSKPKDSWECTHMGVKLQIRLTPFGHVGIFPEHADIWNILSQKISRPVKVLNLFAYTGGASIALRKAGAEVVHVDSAKGINDWAKENAKLNGISDGIRFITEDVRKFVKRELRRGNTYDIIMLDPPSFGRGSKGEVFKVEDDLCPLLDDLKQLLSKDALAFVLSSHTPGWTPVVLRNMLLAYFQDGKIKEDELCLNATSPSLKVPCGAYALWESE